MARRKDEMDEVRIVRDKNILHGSPVISGTRTSAFTVLEQLRVGNGEKNYVLKVYPHLNQRQINAVLKYAGKCVNEA